MSAIPATTTINVRAEQLVALALRCLPRMYQAERGLFCFKMVERDGQMVPVDVSTRYTAMVILGLQSAVTCGQTVPWPMEHLLDGLLAQTQSTRALGDLGLILWATTVCDPARAKPVLAEIEHRWPSEVNQADSNLETIQLAWLISGLCKYLVAVPNDPRAQALLTSGYDRLVKWHYCQQTNLFYYCSCAAHALRLRLLKPVCFFAEQVYGMQALAFYAELMQTEHARTLAVKTADLMVARQTGKGGWCWLYNTDTAAVVDVYPLYTVHQLGMGPMALLPLAGPQTGRLVAAVQRGIEWVYGANEHGRSLLDPQLDVIWRSIKPRVLPRQRQQFHKALAIGHLPAFGTDASRAPNTLQIDYETRPYEYGWWLYALSAAAKKTT